MEQKDVSPTKIEFVGVNKNHYLFPKVCALFKKIIEPIYGDQTADLSKIGESKDRACEIMTENNSPRGVLAYKTDLTDEYAPSALEIKTLFVIEAENNRGRGLGKKLLDQVSNYAAKKQAKNIVVTVSSEVPESLRFFLNNGFSQVAELKDKYKIGATEYVLVKPLS